MKPVQSFTTLNTHRNWSLKTRTANSNNQEREEILPMLKDVNLEDISTRILTSVAIPTSPGKKRSVPYAPPSASGQRSTPDSFIETPDALALEHGRDDVWEFLKNHPHVIEPLHPTHAVEYSTPQIPGLCTTGALFWPHGGPIMEPHQSPSVVGFGILGLFATSTVPSQFDHQGLLSYPFNGDHSMSKWYTKEPTTYVCTSTAQVNTQTSVPSAAGCPSLQGSPLASAHADPAYELHLPGGVDDSSTCRLGNVVTTRPSSTRESQVQSLVWPIFSPPTLPVPPTPAPPTYVLNDETIRICAAETGENPLEGHRFRALSVAYSPDGHHIISGSINNSNRIWDAETSKPLEGRRARVSSVAHSPNGHHIISGSIDNTTRIWDAGTGKPLEGHSARALSVAHSPDGCHTISGSIDNTIRIWDAETGKPLEGHGAWVLSAAHSPNGDHIISGSIYNTLQIWDAGTGKPLEGHSARALSVAHSPDGRHITSESVDNTTQIWDATRTLSVAHSPDGRHIISGSIDDTTRLEDALNAETSKPPDGHDTTEGVQKRGMRP